MYLHIGADKSTISGVLASVVRLGTNKYSLNVRDSSEKIVAIRNPLKLIICISYYHKRRSIIHMNFVAFCVVQPTSFGRNRDYYLLVILLFFENRPIAPENIHRTAIVITASGNMKEPL
jgi:hypothetical protein